MKLAVLLPLATWTLAACGARTALEDPSRTPTDAAVADHVDTGPTLPPTAIVLADRCHDPRTTVVRIDPDTGARTVLFQPPDSYQAGPINIVASPDGRRFAWAAAERVPGQASWGAYLQEGATGTPRRLAWSGLSAADNIASVSWAADGTRLLASLYSPPTYTIGHGPAGDGAVTRVPESEGLSLPAWSPTGAWIAGLVNTPGTTMPLRVGTVRGGFQEIASARYPGALSFAGTDLVAAIEAPGRDSLVIRRVPSGAVLNTYPIPDAASVPVAIAREPGGTRLVVQFRSALMIFERTTGTWRLLDPGCSLVHSGLSWVHVPG